MSFSEEVTEIEGTLKKKDTHIKVCPNTIKITFYLLSPASTMQYRRATKEGQNAGIYIYSYIRYIYIYISRNQPHSEEVVQRSGQDTNHTFKSPLAAVSLRLHRWSWLS